MRTMEWHVTYNTYGLGRASAEGAAVPGDALHQPHIGERLVGALTHFQVTDLWDGSHPTLTLYAGDGLPSDSLYVRSFLLAHRPGFSNDYALDLPDTSPVRVITNDQPVDVVWQAATNPLRLIVSDTLGAATGSTRGAGILRVTFA